MSDVSLKEATFDQIVEEMRSRHRRFIIARHCEREDRTEGMDIRFGNDFWGSSSLIPPIGMARDDFYRGSHKFHSP